MDANIKLILEYDIYHNTRYETLVDADTGIFITPRQIVEEYSESIDSNHSIIYLMDGYLLSDAPPNTLCH